MEKSIFMDMEELLQLKLEEIERGEPLEQVVASLPEDARALEGLLRLAMEIRSLPCNQTLKDALNRHRYSRIQ